MSLIPSFPVCDYDPSVFGSMASACTCSYEGYYGHLVWTFMFPCKLREYLPTIFDYLLLANIAPFFYGPCWAAMPMVCIYIVKKIIFTNNIILKRLDWIFYVFYFRNDVLYGKP